MLTVEKFFLALSYLTKGESLDIHTLVTNVNKKYANLTPINHNNVELLTAVSQQSHEAFDQILIKLNLSLYRELLTEFYSIILF